MDTVVKIKHKTHLHLCTQEMVLLQDFVATLYKTDRAVIVRESECDLGSEGGRGRGHPHLEIAPPLSSHPRGPP